MKEHLLGMTILLVFSFAGQLSIADESTTNQLSVLGSFSAASVTNGWVFVGGEYLQLPYSISRNENRLLVNDRFIELLFDWPPIAGITYGTKSSPPSVPTGINASTTKHAPEVKQYLFDSIDYCIHEDFSNRTEVVASLMRRLPCVASARPATPSQIVVEWTATGSDGILIGVYPEELAVRGFELSMDNLFDYLELVDGEVEYLASDLQNGEYVFFPTKTDPHQKQFGKSPKSMFRVALPLIDAGKSAEEISAAVEAQTGAPFPVSFCRALLNHKDSLDTAFRARIYGGNPATTQAP